MTLTVYWQPGCTSCLRTKEFLREHGVEFESVNVREDPQAMERLAALGARSVPVVARGDAFVYGQDLATVARFAGIEAGLQRLDVPVLVSRDGPIAAIDPRENGLLAGQGALAAAEAAASEPAEAPVQVVEAQAPAVELLAVRPSWVRVQSADGTVLFEKILDAGERYEVPQMEEPAVLRAGNSGSVYFAVNGQTYGPAAPGAQVVKNVALSPEALTGTYQLADLTVDPDLAAIVAMADVPADAAAVPAAPVAD